MNAEGVAKRIKGILKMFDVGSFETEMTLIKKLGDEDTLGISDTGENTSVEEYLIKTLLIIRGADRTQTGEAINGSELGNNPKMYIEFIRIANDTKKGTLPNIETGNEIKYQGKIYTIIDKMPVILAGELLIEQFTAEGVL